MINVFIGFDTIEAVAFYTLQHSIMLHSSEPVNITPVYLPNLRGMFTRRRDPLQSNDFSFSRWLVPKLSRYQGWSIFMDCDMLCRYDIADLWSLRDDKYSVQVVKHDHVPKEDTKYLGKTQTQYAKKNWSSVMLFNNVKCAALTTEYVNAASGLALHQFKWLKDDALIGELPNEWNHLVGYDAFDEAAKLAHFTSGGPYFNEYANCAFSNEWRDAYRRMVHCEQLRAS